MSKPVRVLHRNVVADVARMTGWRAAHVNTADAGRECTLVPFEGRVRRRRPADDALTVVVSPVFTPTH